MGAGIVSPVHIVFLVVVALLLFGAKRLPEIGRSLGTGMREFKDSVTAITETPDETRSALAPPHTGSVPAPEDRDEASKAA